MKFALALNLDNVKYYGNIPEILDPTLGKAEIYELDYKDWHLFDKDFIDPVDNLCGALMDNGDVDYLNAEQCKLLSGWLQERLTKPCDEKLVIYYEKLLEFANRAIELGTGVVIEF